MRYDYYMHDRVHDRVKGCARVYEPHEYHVGVNWRGERVAYVPYDDPSGNCYDCQVGHVFENDDPEMLDEDCEPVPLGAIVFEESYEEHGWACGPFYIDDTSVDDSGHTVMDLLEDSYVGRTFKFCGEEEAYEYLDWAADMAVAKAGGSR